MSEIADVLAAIESLHERGERMALATIVAVRGSTYRRPGARLLVPESGELVGNISGGCLEGDVADVANVVMVEGQPRLVNFDLTADDEAVWGWGLGCNGAIDVFVEPAEKAAEVAGALRMALEEQRPIAAATVLESDVAGVERGARLIVRPDGSSEGGTGDARLDEAARQAALELLDEGRSEIRALAGSNGEARAFVEVLEPPLRLVICGAGHDAIPVVHAAAQLGWRVTVADEREAFLTRERFPEAADLLRVERPELAAATVGTDRRTNVVVMSHNYLRDKDYLRGFLGTGVPYIGMLGPRSRTDRLLQELRSEGVQPTEEDLEAMHGPAGLDVGSDSPEEIAAAIAAEILAVRRTRGAGFLRERQGPIHERPQPATRGA
ncbi:MAG: XdhC family protein [Actinomycetota bacterium]|nr:XdhC family protein [Actinomycetota bacterium]